MSIINNMPSRPGVDIDGIIQSYYVYAGENISAGSFVEFVNGVANQNSTSGGNAYQITSRNTSGIYSCVLDTNKVFIIFTYDSVSYAKIIITRNNTITQYTQYSIPYSSSTINWSGCCAITSNKVLLVSSGSNGGNAMIANISGTTITFVEPGIGIYNKAINNIDCNLVEPNKVSISFIQISNNQIVNVIATVTDNVITLGTATTFSGYAISYMMTRILGRGLEIAMFYNTKSGTTTGWYACTFRYSIANDSVTFQPATLISDTDLTSNYYSIDCCVINPNTTLLTFNNYLMLLKIDNYSITYGNKYSYSTGAAYPYCCLIDTDKVIINFNDSYNSSYPTSIIVNIKGDIVSCGEKFVYGTTQILGRRSTSGYPRCFLVDSGKITLYYPAYVSSNMYHAYAQVLYASGDTVSKTTSYEKQVRNVTQSLCDGLSSTAGVGGTSTAHNEAIDVYVPKDQFNLIPNGDFNDGSSNWVINYGTVTTDPTYGNYLACTWNYNTSGLAAAKNNKYISSAGTGNKFYICCNAKGYSTNTGSVKLECLSEVLDITNNDTWSFYSKIFTDPSDLDHIEKTNISIKQYSATYAGNKLDITNIKGFNLTQMFGAGNEPDKAWCDTHLGGDIS